jgi:FkbM family methyltransferase
MRELLRNTLRYTGLLPYLQVMKEKYFPSKYVIKSKTDDQRYIEFYSRFINENDLCFDVGAHRGHRTNIFVKLGAKVVAFEPQYELYKYIQVKFGKKVVVENMGLASSVRRMNMFMSNASSLSTFSPDWLRKSKERFGNIEWNKTKEIQLSTLDTMINKYGRPKFCKIDVEGFEYEVLQGLSSGIQYISFEFMTPENSEIISSCLQRLHDINPAIRINYSIGDTLALEWNEWVNYETAIELFTSTLYRTNTWGDVYIEMKA